jgi:uncharacterized cupin superfamily protein
VVNARQARWLERPGRGLRCGFEGEPEFPQLGVSLYVLEPGEPIGMYHWEADEEAFLVLDGAALLIVEGQERPLGQWDFVHCPAGTDHMIVGAGERPCVVLAVGAREHAKRGDWGGYRVDEAALRHDVGVWRQTSDVDEAYAPFAELGRRAIATARLPAGDARAAADLRHLRRAMLPPVRFCCVRDKLCFRSADEGKSPPRRRRSRPTSSFPRMSRARRPLRSIAVAHALACRTAHRVPARGAAGCLQRSRAVDGVSQGAGSASS